MTCENGRKLKQNASQGRRQQTEIKIPLKAHTDRTHLLTWLQICPTFCAPIFLQLRELPEHYWQPCHSAFCARPFIPPHAFPRGSSKMDVEAIITITLITPKSHPVNQDALLGPCPQPPSSVALLNRHPSEKLITSLLGKKNIITSISEVPWLFMQGKEDNGRGRGR